MIQNRLEQTTYSAFLILNFSNSHLAYVLIRSQNISVIEFAHAKASMATDTPRCSEILNLSSR